MARLYKHGTMVREFKFTVGRTEYTYREMTDGKILRQTRYADSGKPSGWKLSKYTWDGIHSIAEKMVKEGI